MGIDIKLIILTINNFRLFIKKSMSVIIILLVYFFPLFNFNNLYFNIKNIFNEVFNKLNLFKIIFYSFIDISNLIQIIKLDVNTFKKLYFFEKHCIIKFRLLNRNLLTIIICKFNIQYLLFYIMIVITLLKQNALIKWLLRFLYLVYY